MFLALPAEIITVGTGIINNDARTSVISLSGLKEENMTKRFSFS